MFAMRNRLLEAWKTLQVVEQMIEQEKQQQQQQQQGKLDGSASSGHSYTTEEDENMEDGGSSSGSNSNSSASPDAARKMRLARTKLTRHKRVFYKRLLDHIAARGGDGVSGDASTASAPRQPPLMFDADKRSYRERRGAKIHSTDCGRDKISDEEALRAIDFITLEMLNRFQDRPM